MEPATALGVAAGIAQFVSFAFKLFSGTKEIFDSAKGSTDQIHIIDKVYKQLQDLSTRLQKPTRMEPGLELLAEDKSIIAAQTTAINDLSRLCINDCNSLILTIPKLKGNPDTMSRWQSFKVALKTVWKEKEIAGLEQRLQIIQDTLLLEVCSLTSVWQKTCLRELVKLRTQSDRLGLVQSAKLDDINLALNKVNSRLEAPKEPFSSADIKSLENLMSQLSLSEFNVSKEHEIFKSLNFESRAARFQGVPEAHKRTYGWIFDNRKKVPSDGLSAKGNIHEWLKTGQEWFWVSGKPGSGKSTLMKYIASHPKTPAILSAWASPHPIVIAKHYFWSAGTPMQRSLQGLLRSLLYDVFRQLPDLIETTCTERWSKPKEHLGHEDWDTTELQAVVERIATQKSISARFCFFIDGLDEFEGDHIDSCAALRELTKSGHIKICISSRSWNVFEDFFGQNPNTKLYMHELTRRDIQNYTESRLKEHPRWSDLHIERVNAAWLINQITERAGGVFLWVFLVTQLLRSGLTEYDSFSDLKRRLDSVPRDLRAFFKLILDSVEPFYHEKMATTLKIALAALQPAPTAIYEFHENEWDDEDYALKLVVQAPEVSQTEARQKQITRRLNARCRGLLEVNSPSDRVEFLHRTVMDYLRSQEMTEYLDHKAPVGFDPNRSLSRAFLAYLKTTRFAGYLYWNSDGRFYGSTAIDVIGETMSYAVQSQNREKDNCFLPELERCILGMCRSGHILLELQGRVRPQPEPLDPSARVRLDPEHALPAYVDGIATNTILGASKLLFLELGSGNADVPLP